MRWLVAIGSGVVAILLALSTTVIAESMGDGNDGIIESSPGGVANADIDLDGTYDLITDADGDSGINSSGNDDEVCFFTSGANERFCVTTANFESSLSDGPAIRNLSKSSTVATYAWKNDGNTGVGSAGEGAVSLIGNSVEGLRVYGAVEDTAPTEPVTCNASSVNTIVSVDDTDDSGAAEVCMCVATGDDGAGSPNAWDWWNILDGGACALL